jgi:hypothetical protein
MLPEADGEEHADPRLPYAGQQRQVVELTSLARFGGIGVRAVWAGETDRRPASLWSGDVARLAGVSVSSARNYFSRPQLLSTQTHARIKAAVTHTGYHPRGSPAGLGRRQLGRIGFEVPRGEDPAHNPIFNQLLLSGHSPTAAGMGGVPLMVEKRAGAGS